MKLIQPVLLATLLALSACTVQWQNTQPAKEMAAEKARPPGSVYTGWRVFQDKCATCHGGDAMGTARGADLTQRLRGLGQREFVGLVLQRYDWGIPKPGADAAAREAQIDSVMLRRQGALTMPAWSGEPEVTAHIADLYTYVSARAQGTLGTGRPAP